MALVITRWAGTQCWPSIGEACGTYGPVPTGARSRATRDDVAIKELVELRVERIEVRAGEVMSITWSGPARLFAASA
jgi:hypothetical protein